jgi:hypothetical protein
MAQTSALRGGSVLVRVEGFEPHPATLVRDCVDPSLIRDGHHLRRRGCAGRTLKPLKLGERTRNSLLYLVADEYVVVANSHVPIWVRVSIAIAWRRIPRAPVKSSGLRDTNARPQTGQPQTSRNQQSGYYTHDRSTHKLELSTSRNPAVGIWR